MHWLMPAPCNNERARAREPAERAERARAHSPGGTAAARSSTRQILISPASISASRHTLCHGLDSSDSFVQRAADLRLSHWRASGWWPVFKTGVCPPASHQLPTRRRAAQSSAQSTLSHAQSRRPSVLAASPVHQLAAARPRLPPSLPSSRPPPPGICNASSAAASAPSFTTSFTATAATITAVRAVAPCSPSFASHFASRSALPSLRRFDLPDSLPPSLPRQLSCPWTPS